MNKLKLLTIAFIITLNVALNGLQNGLSANCNPILISSNQNDIYNLKKQDTIIFNSVLEVFKKYKLKS
jgi:hypothetical protein